MHPKSAFLNCSLYPFQLQEEAHAALKDASVNGVHTIQEIVHHISLALVRVEPRHHSLGYVHMPDGW